MTTKSFSATVSRTLSPEGLGLLTVVGQHDRQLTDADTNLIQDLQDFKRQRVLGRQAPSGCLTLDPLQFSPYTENCFFIPTFDVLFRGEVLTIQGNQSTDPLINKVVLPGRQRRWAPGSLGDDATLYAVFLELWAKTLSPVDATGYHTDEAGNRFFYPGGCVDAVGSNLLAYPDDVIDPFMVVMTTLRAQMQWRLRVEALPLAYDFTKGRYGLDPDPSLGVALLGRGPQAEPSAFPFGSLVSVTGEPCLWRAGDGNPNNGLGTMDGYTYAMPVAVAFQRNAGVYYPDANPFGCAPASNASAGSFASGVSGRLDGKFYDIVYPEDVVDTRTSVSLTGQELEPLASRGLTDLFTGAVTAKVARGEAPGAKPTALGSRLTYTVALAARDSVVNVDTVGSLDGWSNGFSSDSRVFRTTRVFTLADRSIIGTDPVTGQANASVWGVGDVIPIPLGAQVVEGAGIVEVFVQGLMTQADGSKSPLSLYGGQLQIGGLNTRQATIRIVSDLSRLAMSPGSNPLIVTVGVRYPAGGADTRKVPTSLAGGTLTDSLTGNTLPVFGVSEYEAFEELTPRTSGAVKLQVCSPLYSPGVFGVRVVLRRPNTGVSGPAVTYGDQGAQLNTFTLPRLGLDGSHTGVYVVSARDSRGRSLAITRRGIVDESLTVTLSGQLSATDATEFTVLCHRTATVAVNPPVRGVTALEETVLAGNTHQGDLTSDPRITVASVKYVGSATQIVLYATSAQLHGISGDDKGGTLVWVLDSLGTFQALPATVSFQTGLVTLTVPANNLEGVTWFTVAALRPTLPAASSLLLAFNYIPYQGEGVEGRDYEVVYTPEHALVTTNGTGAPPIVGLQDVFPFDRQRPISTVLPSLMSWSDAQLRNQALTTEADGNFVAKRFANVSHTLSARLHTNDFITPLHGYVRKKIRMATRSGRQGFSRAFPHVGFAISNPTPRSVLGDNLQATISAVTLFVNNRDGNDGGDGLTRLTAKRTIRGALAALPPVVRHPVSIILVDTGYAYTVKDVQRVDFSQALLGDGETRAARHYCLGQIAFVMQEAARITIGRETTTGERVVIDATGFGGFGDGPTYAFLVSDSRVIFHGITFTGFVSPVVKAIDSDVEFLDCDLGGNLLGCSAEQGSFVTFNRGVIRLGAGGIGCVAAASQVQVDATQLKAVSGPSPAAFFVAERSASLTFQRHNVGLDASMEDGITPGTVVALARTGSTVVCDPSWVSHGRCQLQTNSTLVRSVALEPFQGGTTKDASSSDVPNL